MVRYIKIFGENLPYARINSRKNKGRSVKIKSLKIYILNRY